MKAGVCYGGILLMNSSLTEELMAIQKTVFGGKTSSEYTTLGIREAGELVRRSNLAG